MTTSADFQALFQRGKRIDRPSLLVLWTTGSHGRRAGFAVTRQLKRAVDRNRVRRRLRAAYRTVRGAAPESTAMVIVGKKRILTIEFKRLVLELEGALGAMVASEPATGARA